MGQETGFVEIHFLSFSDRVRGMGLLIERHRPGKAGRAMDHIFIAKEVLEEFDQASVSYEVVADSLKEQA